MKRKDFIHITTLASIAFLLPSCEGSVGIKKTIATPDTLSYLLDEKKINAIGKKYCEMYPNENKKSFLLNKLIGEKHFENGRNIYDEKEVIKKIMSKIKSDYSSGNVVVINGWLLSKTELRQCALYNLLK